MQVKNFPNSETDFLFLGGSFLSRALISKPKWDFKIQVNKCQSLLASALPFYA